MAITIEHGAFVVTFPQPTKGAKDEALETVYI